MNITSRARIRSFATLGAAALLATSAGSAAAAPGGVPAIPLNVGQEVTGSNTGAHGFFSYTIDDDELCYTLSVSNLSGSATGAHIHIGLRREAGRIEVTLDTRAGTSWTVEDCIKAGEGDLSQADLDAISSNPRNYYVNVHTPTFLGGEVRGQLK
ncbi:CHRD domain-containing protein [Arthrobacter sp. ISL-30]|uniref:CHRD domain-containing protein n=1 Tax=Arthrobacter sp. ISL-30 TaxID=2819109 RepID=UPI001BE583D2|nr:CHRD domain-containing protein [Arthrobacter sp. ISL-30]MBT2515099.1 CHRD domain-containing protein [Arthrobacter sp. ISL-30]